MNEIFIGAMSGTSMDGISLGCFEFLENVVTKTIAFKTYSLPDDYKGNLLNMIKAKNCSFDSFGQMDNLVGELFAKAIISFMQEFNIDPKNVTAIGSHGQTIWHAPAAERPFTLQIGDPNLIAAKTGVTTVADFRRADMAAGGCGAPLAPAFHLNAFATQDEARCIVNIGGFSNISILNHKEFLGFDTGPGNCLLDYWVQKFFKQEFDKDGAIAASSSPNQKLLAYMLTDPYFKRKAPKSTGREYFNSEWLNSKLQECSIDFQPEEVLSTLLHLTCRVISDAIKNYSVPETRVYVCGGGAHNKELLKQLGILLEQQIQTTEVLGVHPDCVETALMAWLANARLRNQALNLSTITGSKQPVILGGIYATS